MPRPPKLLSRTLMLVAVPLMALAVVAQPASAASTSTFSGNLTDGQYVRGNQTTTFRSDGTVNFRGHLHNNGVASYRMSIVCLYPTSDGGAITVSHSGRIKGDIDTIFGGSKNLDWNKNTSDAEVKRAFGKIQNGRCTTSSSLALGTLLDNVIKGAGIVGTVIALF